MSLQSRLLDLINAIGVDIKAIKAKQVVVIPTQADLPPGTPAGTPVMISGTL